MLRHYDSCGLLVPARIDPATGYRLYSATQIADATRITVLRDMGFGIEEIRGLLPSARAENSTVGAAVSDTVLLTQALNAKQAELQERIDHEVNRLARIAAYEARLRKETVTMVFDVEIKNLPAVKVLSLRQVIARYDAESELWEKLGSFVQEAKMPVDYEAGGYSIYHDEDYVETDVDVEIAVPLAAGATVSLNEEATGRGYSIRELEAIPQAATVRFSGPYMGYSDAMAKLAAWTEAEGYVFDGLVRGLAIVSYGCGVSEEELLTEIQVPVRKG